MEYLQSRATFGGQNDEECDIERAFPVEQDVSQYVAKATESLRDCRFGTTACALISSSSIEEVTMLPSERRQDR